MCGACGGGVGDPFGQRVAGPRVRDAIARYLQGLPGAPGIRPFVGGWTISSRTGGAEVFTRVDRLVERLAPRLRIDHDRLLERVLVVAREAGRDTYPVMSVSSFRSEPDATPAP
ncbi:hypothetical protein [Agromyces silvae]|uniref:hypothetical protein n=1 Tax=Agromyces silvae TaxID=3388266 RepID=UPI00280B905C|nr:hypothetical protein [Agromyces protaetiae]